MSKPIRKLKDLLPDENNANRGTERGTGLLEESMRRFGAARSVVADKKGRVIAGNKSVEAAASAGIEGVIVVPSDGKKLVVVQRTDLDLDERDARELAVADNRVGQLNLDWAPGALEAMGRDGFLSQMFTQEEWDALLARADAPDEFGEVGEDVPTDYECPRCHFKWSGKPKPGGADGAKAQDA